MVSVFSARGRADVLVLVLGSVVAVFGFLVVASSHAAATNVGGTIATDTHWTVAGSPYVVTSDITIQGTDGADGVTTLTIDPGVTVKFDQYHNLYVGTASASQPGALVAQGTAANPILFTSDQVSHTRGFWGQVAFEPYASDTITDVENTTFEYGGYSSGEVYASSNSPTLKNDIIQQSGTDGFYSYNSAPTLTGSTFTSNAGNGAYVYVGNPVFTSDTFSSNGQYGVYTYSGRPTVTSDTFTSNSQRPLRMAANSPASGNTFTSNTIEEIELLGATVTTDTTYPHYVDTASSTPLVYIVLGEIDVQGTDGADGVTTLTLSPGVEMHFNQYVSLVVGTNSASQPGALVASGTAALPITLTSNQVSKTRGFWGEVQFNHYASDAISALRNVTIQYGGYSSGELYVYQAQPVVRDCVIEQSGTDGVYVYFAAPDIETTTVRNNTAHGVYVYTNSGEMKFNAGTLSGNGQYGLYSDNSALVDVTNSVIASNAQRPLRVHPDATVSGNTFTSNGIQEIEIQGGTHTRDQTLARVTDSLSGNPLTYVYNGAISVEGTAGSDGVTTLTVAAGVTVAFDHYASMNIGSNSAGSPGALVAQGTAALPILFTSHQASKTPGYWGPLEFNDFASESVSKIANATVEYGGSGTAAVYLYQFSGTFDAVTIRNNTNYGLYLYNANPVFKNGKVNDNALHGVYNYFGSPTFTGTTFRNNSQYGLYTVSGTPQVHDDSFVLNHQRPLRVAPDSVITGNTYDRNSIQEIEFIGGTHTLDKTLGLVTDVTSGTPLTYVYTSSVTVQGTDGGDGVTALTVAPGVTVAFDQYASMNIGSNSPGGVGALVASGTAASPIVFTSHQVSKTAGYWGPLEFNDFADDGVSAFRNATVEYGGYSTGALYLYHFDGTFRDCTVKSSGQQGVYIYDHAPTFVGCTVRDSTLNGVYTFVGNPTFRDGALRNNLQYGFYANSGTPNVFNDQITGNHQRPLRVAPDSVITGNTYDQNTIQEIEFLGGTHTLDKTLARVIDVTTSAPLTYVYTGGVTIEGTDGADGVTALTVAPGVTVAFDQYAGITVGTGSASLPGALNAAGTAASPIVFTSHQVSKTAGWWYGLTFDPYADTGVSAMRNVTVEYGGYSQAGIYVYQYSGDFRDCTVRSSSNYGVYIYNANPTFENCTIRDSAAHGVYTYVGNPTFTGTTFRNNGQYGFYTNSGTPQVHDDTFVLNHQRPLRVAPDSVITGNTYDSNTIEEIEFLGGTHTLVKTLPLLTDVTTLAPVKYVYTGSVTIEGTDGANGVTTLTIAPGVTVAFDQYAAMYVGTGSASQPGALVASGTAAQPITFTSHQSGTKTKGYWGTLEFNDFASDSLSVLANVTIEYGGQQTAGLYLYRFPATISDCTVSNSGNYGVYVYDSTVTLDRCTIRDNTLHGVYGYDFALPGITVENGLIKNNGQYGVYMQNGFATVTGNTIQLNKQRPLRLDPNSNFAGNTYRSNVIEEIEFFGGNVQTDQTLPRILDADTSAPLAYDYVGSISVDGTDGADGVTSLTISPGVTVKFDPNTQASFGGSATSPGALFAQGTAALPITITSHRATPVAGDWYGLSWSNANAHSDLENVTLSYAGESTAAFYDYNSDVKIANSHITRATNYGAYLYGLTGYTFGPGNEIDHATRGVEVASGSAYDVLGNRLDNDSYGLYVETGVQGTFTGNTIVDNTNRGTYFAGTGSRIYDNVFRNTVNAEDRGNGNLWNVTKVSASPGTNVVGGPFYGGNRWSNYTGKDFTGDALGDTLLPMRTIGKGQDWHPLMLLSETTIDTTPPVTTMTLAGAAGNAGWWRSAVTSTLTATDDVSGVNATYWTRDGGSQTTYTAPFTTSGDGSHALTYWSVDNAGNAETPHAASLNIDTVPPTTTVALAGTLGNGGWYRSTVTATATATDATSGVASTSYILDGGAATPVTGPIVIAGDGTHTLKTFSTDVAGNVEAQKTTSVKIDTTPPTTTISNGPPSYTAGAARYVTWATMFTLSANDTTSGVAVTHYGFGGPLGVYAAPFNLTGADGARTIQYNSTDVAGNPEALHGATYLLDDTAPTVSVLHPRPMSISALSVYEELESDGDGWPDAVETALGSNPYDGNDRPGLLGLGNAVVLPQPVADAYHQHAYAFIVAGTNVPLAANASDPVVNGVASGMARVDFLLDGHLLGSATSAPWTYSWNTNNLVAGEHLLQTKAYDHLGNAREVDVHVFGISLATQFAGAPTIPELLAPFQGMPMQADAATFDALLQAIADAQVKTAHGATA
ncbi:MAG: right-handed parallel beta-helix repeat-containing protein [Thermoplasmatota archaeon]